VAHATRLIHQAIPSKEFNRLHVLWRIASHAHQQQFVKNVKLVYTLTQKLANAQNAQ
jgi:hypothetical protein